MTDIERWIASFTEACKQGDGNVVAALFADDGLWRDYLAFDLTLQTVEGRDAVCAFANRYGANAAIQEVHVKPSEQATEGGFTFRNKLGQGRAYLRLENGLCKTLFTSLQSLHKPSQTETLTENTDAPYVLIVGGGQCGLALGAQLSHLNIPYLIIDKYPNVGDQWRSRYKSLVLHDPVWYDHLPFKPFPSSWPVFTPKDQMGDFLEDYANELGLNIQTGTELVNAQFDQSNSCWTATVKKNGLESSLTATHLVMALGLSGFPHTPEFEGHDVFNGAQMHSSAYQPDADWRGKNVLVIGANNSAHDIAADLVANGAHPVMLQRSSTLVVKQSVYCEKLLGKLYSREAVANGISADEADFISASIPLRMLESLHRELWKSIAFDDEAYYQRIRDAGFTLDFAEDGTGLGLKYRRTASGYYIDVGATELVIDGRIPVRSGYGVQALTEQHVVLDNGEAIPADAIIYATGYGNMIDWVSVLIDKSTAEKVGPCWGYGSATRGDPGPWVGELRNMWCPTSQDNLWFMGGNLAQARYFSGILALQLSCARAGCRY